jgi:uncharacterized OB-fold protein
MEIPRHWRLKAQRYRLEGSVCPVCGQVTFPPRPVCPHCTAKPVRLAGYGFSPILASNRTLAAVSSKGG